MTSQYFSGVKWEQTVGYCRALKSGDMVYLSGTTATDDEGNIVGKDNPYEQTHQTLKNIRRALNYFGLDYEHVIRTRMFVTDITRWEEYGRAHGEIFGKIHPVSTMVEVSRLINPEMMIEIEVEARE